VPLEFEDEKSTWREEDRIWAPAAFAWKLIF